MILECELHGPGDDTNCIPKVREFKHTNIFDYNKLLKCLRPDDLTQIVWQTSNSLCLDKYVVELQTHLNLGSSTKTHLQLRTPGLSTKIERNPSQNNLEFRTFELSLWPNTTKPKIIDLIHGLNNHWRMHIAHFRQSRIKYSAQLKNLPLKTGKCLFLERMYPFVASSMPIILDNYGHSIDFSMT